LTPRILPVCRSSSNGQADRNNTLFYIDPPYYDTVGYAVSFEHQDYLDLAASSYHKKVRQIFSDFRIRAFTTRYSVGEPRTAPKTRSVEQREVIIRNF
jgi:hypothetical protein